MAGERHLSVRDLVLMGAIEAPTIAQGEREGQTIEATLAEDGTFLWNGKTFASPSVAAGRAITDVTKRSTPGRTYLSVNGWLFWQVVAKDGKKMTLHDIRTAALGRAADDKAPRRRR